MNLVKKGLLFGTCACLGITLYASLGQETGKASALEDANLTSLTENAQNLSNLEASLNNLLLATNRINFINNNLISVSSNYMLSLQGSNTTLNSGNVSASQTTQNTANSAQLYSSTQNSQLSTENYGTNKFFAGRMNDELSKLNTSASDVRGMLGSISLETAKSINFNDYAKALNMAAENLNNFSSLSLGERTNDYPVSKRLAFASIRISNQALDQIKAKIGGTNQTLNSSQRNENALSSGQNSVSERTNNQTNNLANQANGETSSSLQGMANVNGRLTSTNENNSRRNYNTSIPRETNFPNREITNFAR